MSDAIGRINESGYFDKKDEEKATDEAAEEEEDEAKGDSGEGDTDESPAEDVAETTAPETATNTEVYSLTLSRLERKLRKLGPVFG